jgi:folate-binding protein YgfZ
VGDVSHDVADEVRLLRSGAAAPLARDVVRVVGPDAEQFLGGQLSADLSALAPEEGAWSLLCEPTGKLGWWLRISRLGADEFLLDVDAGYGEVVVARLQRFLLRTDATIALEPSDAWVALAVRGPREVRLDHEAGATVLTLPSPWPGLLGWDVLAPTDAHVRLDLDVVSADALHALRVECGVPALGAEITDGTIAAELGQWLIDASVSFTKGCYVGQELVARIDSRRGCRWETRWSTASGSWASSRAWRCRRRWDRWVWRWWGGAWSHPRRWVCAGPPASDPGRSGPCRWSTIC